MRRLAIVLLALLLAFGAAACAGDEDIAGVGGTIIKFSDVRALYEDEPAVDDGFRDTLFARIALEALTQALSTEFAATVDPEAVEAYFTEFENSMNQAGYTPAELLGVENASLELVRFNAEVVALRDAALEKLVVSPEIVDGLFADPATLTRVCAKHVLTETLEEAEAARTRLIAGEDFATVAAEVSLDTQSQGGDLGCTLASDYVEEFAEAVLTAPLNEVTGPVESEFGFHVIVVSERTVPTRVEYLAGPWEILSSSAATLIWSNWITEVLAAADVWVADAYGTWAEDSILPPASEATTTTSATTTTGG